jgi:sugar phosphate isomerase/epimerase
MRRTMPLMSARGIDRERIGLTAPDGWWSSPAFLKSLEAAGFGLVQMHAPPASVLSDSRQSTSHAASLRRSLDTTELRPMLHAPAGLRAGSPAGDRAFEGLLAYAAEIGATHVVYHACALPDAPESDRRLLFEARSLAALANRAERLEVTIAIENLAPVYPGPELLSASPLSLRGLAHRIGSERIGICLDLGHAHITAELRRTSLAHLIEPAIDAVALYHAHDNFGARWRSTGAELGVDPLRLDLHLPPGRGMVSWPEIAPLITRTRAPVVLEIHPPYRPRASDALAAFERALGSGPAVARQTAALAGPRTS